MENSIARSPLGAPVDAPAISPVIADRGRGYQLFKGGKGGHRLGALPFVAIHVLALGAIWTGVTWQAAVLCAALYWVRIFAVTAGYHRYFAHRTFRTSRVFQFLLGFLAETSAQKGVLWWASHHRHHHRTSDTPLDVHSPRQRGFWYSHVLWIFDNTDSTDLESVRDLARYPELRLLDRFWLVPPIIVGVSTYFLFGPSGLFFGFFVSTVLTWHGTFTINSLAHVFGSRRFATDDDSRNNLLLALLTFGEGWHNNHHHFMSSTRQGFRWWEIDVTYYVLKAMSWIGLVWRLKEPPRELLTDA
jgi:stearoyl-CoA desaturase (delta-9 desaturase)